MDNIIYMSNEGISTISLNRPKVYNALNPETLRELLAIIKQVKTNDDKIVILTGEGSAFCSGGDINMMESSGSGNEFSELMDLVSEITLELYSLPKILIAAINGSATGLGLSIALNADYIVAEEDAKFGMLFLGVGLVPDGGGHFHLEERLKTHAAKQFIWSMKQIKGAHAKDIGLVDILVESNAIVGANQLANQLKMAPLLTMIQTKEILHAKKMPVLESYLKAEKVGQLKMIQTYDHAEGVRAFLNKEKPLFNSK